jgi:hypothetical protein
MHSLKHICKWSFAALIAAAGAAWLAVPSDVAAGRLVQDSPACSFDTTVCVFGWSKDICQGDMFTDVIDEYGCHRDIDGTVVNCKTVVARDATFEISLQSNGDKCCNDGTTCDETKHLNGKLILQGNFTFRGNQCCPYRGCWCGEWKLIDNSGETVASGTGGGPLGTGSHRAPDCPNPQTQCSPNCEKCYDVQFVPSGVDPFGTWYVGLEGCLNGTVFAGPFKSSAICVTISGHLLTGGTTGGPSSFGQWKFCGASDGTVLAKCSG